MNTLLKTSYLACSIAVALGTNAAHAVVPTTTPGLVVYSGGGSAEPQPVEAAFCRLFNNVDLYSDLQKTQSGSYLVLYGTAINTIGSIPAGTNVLFFYKFNGGSYVNGGIPQTGSQSAAGAAQQLSYPSTASVLGSASLLTAGTQGTVCTATQKGLPTYGYTPVLGSNNPIPDFGITDVEVTMFGGVNNPTTLPLVSVGAPSLVYDLVEGVAVTNSLFTGTGPSGAALSGINKKTNFTRAEVAGILSGSVTDWHDIYADNGSPVAPAGSGIVLIDRNVGSGTKAGGSSYFLGFPGLGGISQAPNSVSNLAGTGNGAGGVNGAGYGPTLAKTQTSQDVQDTSSAAVVKDLTTANSAGLLAIAILSVDNPPALNQVSGVNQYDFVKINGVAMDGNSSTDNINGTTGSSYINVINGSYDFFYQVNFNERSGFSTGAPANNAAFAAGLKAALQSPSLAGVNANAQFPLATNGIVIDGDTASSLATGVTVTSRGGNSPSNPKVVLKVAGSAIPTGNDPL
jgi:hypothetical protein